MALVSIIPSQKRRDEESPLEKIALAFNIAQNALGTALTVPKFLQDRKAGKIAEAQQLQKIAQETEPISMTKFASGQEPEAFDVPGLGLRKALPSLARKMDELQLSKAKADLDARERESKPLDDSQKTELLNFARSQGLDKLPDFSAPETIGEAKDLVNRAFSRQIMTPYQTQSLELQQTEASARRQREGEERAKKTRELLIPDLDQYANTPEDAKSIKETLQTNRKMLGDLNRLIALKSKYPQGAIPGVNAADIAEAKQLSTNILLKYKSLEKLGVLSQADIALIDRLVPQNPLGIDAASTVGESPIMRQLENLRAKISDDRNSIIQSFGLDPSKLKEPKSLAGKVERQGGLNKLSDEEILKRLNNGR